MYRTTEDFINDWSQSAASTLEVIRAISDDKADVGIVEGHNSLGWLAWHVTTAPELFGNMLADADMLAEVKGFYGPASRGAILRKMIDHQTHHVGQMTVLLRQAGLVVPPVMGPTKEMTQK